MHPEEIAKKREKERVRKKRGVVYARSTSSQSVILVTEDERLEDRLFRWLKIAPELRFIF